DSSSRDTRTSWPDTDAPRRSTRSFNTSRPLGRLGHGHSLPGAWPRRPGPFSSGRQLPTPHPFLPVKPADPVTLLDKRGTFVKHADSWLAFDKEGQSGGAGRGGASPPSPPRRRGGESGRLERWEALRVAARDSRAAGAVHGL